MKSTVIIAKVGCVFYTRKLAAKNSRVGEQGETEGVVRHLLDRGDLRVLYFGQWRGDVPENMVLIESSIDGFDEYTSEAEQRAGWAKDVETVSPYEPKMFINVTGYASTCCTIGNPVAATVQAAGIRYCAPALNLMQALRLPRICINNDPRNYPRDGEMAWGWDWCRPRALLSQRTKDWSRQMRGKTYAVREVYSGAENWCEHIRLPLVEKDLPCTVVAHAHIADGCRFRARDDAWANVLFPRSEVELLKEMGMRVYGEGWQHFKYYDPELMLGSIRPDAVMEVLSRSKTCPAVAAGDEFYTGKLRTCLAQECLPLFYGRGEPFTFDPLEKYLSLDDPFRVAEPGDLLRVVKWWDSHEDRRQKLVDELWLASTPDWSLFDSCISEALGGRDMDTDAWWEDYGGYRCDI